jgi:hypothetical protein
MDVAEFRKRGADMNDPQVKIVTAAEARRALTKGDIRDEVAFQNDINTLLASSSRRRGCRCKRCRDLSRARAAS